MATCADQFSNGGDEFICHHARIDLETSLGDRLFDLGDFFGVDDGGAGDGALHAA